jgi:hypothetical protein
MCEHLFTFKSFVFCITDVFLCGGYDSKDIFVDVWKFHLPTVTWTRLLVTMPTPLYFHSTCATKDGCMYVFGGVTHIKNNTRTNQVFKIWLKVPKLKEIAWEALLHYNKTIRSSSHSELTMAGIPPEFVSRVHPAPPCGHGPGTSEHWASEIVVSAPNAEPSRKNISPHSAPLPMGS